MSEKKAAKTEPKAPDPAPTVEGVVTAAQGPTAPERFVPASESRFMTSKDYKAPDVWYCPEADTPVEALLRPEYWANIKQLRPNAHIHVDAEDGSYYAELKVRKVGQGFAIVHLLRHVAFAAVSVPAPADGYEIQFRGPMVKHRVVRLRDGAVLKQGLETEEDAAAWLRDHKKMLAA